MSGFVRWARAAEALSEHVGLALVAAYELRKRAKIGDAFGQYLAFWERAKARGGALPADLSEVGTVAENLMDFERISMVRVRAFLLFFFFVRLTASQLPCVSLSWMTRVHMHHLMTTSPNGCKKPHRIE
jgi:hypothetical protein